jgi:hypothetical protein
MKCWAGRISKLLARFADLQVLVQLFNFSTKNLLINSHQAHQIAAHPFHHLPMGLPWV